MRQAQQWLEEFVRQYQATAAVRNTHNMHLLELFLTAAGSELSRGPPAAQQAFRAAAALLPDPRRFEGMSTARREYDS